MLTQVAAFKGFETMKHPFLALAAEYESWVANVRPCPERALEIDRVARKLIQPNVLGRFDEVFAEIGVPQVVQAVICERENGCDFTKSPAQGDRWDRVSTHVPRNRGPFTSWKASAIDAWTVCDHLAEISIPQWTMVYACWKWEGFNGFGYRARGLRTPYVLGGTNLQQPGKFVADGQFDPAHMDGQLGALPIAMRMIELMPRLALGGPAIAPSIVPDVTPLPVGVGGAGADGVWQTDEIQRALAGLGYDVGPTDGSYGRKTRAAVRAFQHAHGLTEDGLAGTNETLPALAAAVAAKA